MKLGKKSLLMFLGCAFFIFGFASTAEASVVDESITSEVSGVTGIAVVPAPDGSGVRKEYASSAAGLSAALYDLYQYGNGADFAIYFGATLNASAVFAETAPATPNATNMTFTALKGKVGNLVLVAAPNDTITNNTGAATGAKTITFGTDAYFATNLILRNITYTTTNIYMNGNNISLNGNSHSGAATNIYGGAKASDVTGSPTITINSTGAGAWSINGGNNTGGTLTGDITININGASTTGALSINGGGNAGNVNGNVTTTVNVENPATNLRLGQFVGGTSTTTGGTTSSAVRNTGNISGTVSNTIKGYGGWASATTFSGGSITGNIGGNPDIAADRQKDAIINNVDTSSFSTNSVEFMGANYTSGIVTGKITNTIKAGQYNKGSMRSVDGAAGRFISNPTLFAENEKNSVRDAAKAIANFKVFGDISTDILGGCISHAGGDYQGYMRGTGFAGYYEGNTTLIVGRVGAADKVGGEGFAYSSASSAVYNNPNTFTRLYRASDSPGDGINTGSNDMSTRYAGGFDIVGGGGYAARTRREFYVVGDTNVTMNNVIARWTYGGSFSGITEGNSQITLNGGIVNTLEGAGYQATNTLGNSKSVLNNGQVDDFFCGGSWDDTRITGNTHTESNGGVINATFGGNFGFSGNSNPANEMNTVTGNATVLITGGDFSGFPDREGWGKGLSAGPSYGGKILGNTEMTVDLRGKGPNALVLSKSTKISAGKPDNARASSVLIGTDASNTMTLNIYTDENSGDVLNGATILGDSAPAANTRSGKVNININAPGSNLGTIYATEYSNLSGNQLVRDVDINIQNLKSIDGLSGGGTATTGTGAMSSVQDNFTNAIKDSTNKSNINIGILIDAESPIQEEPITVGETNTNSIGIVNFTSMGIFNQTFIQTKNGNIKNGNGADKNNHKTSYYDFGPIYLSDGSGLGVTTATGLISAGLLTVEDEGSIESGQGAGIININDIEFLDPDASRLTWIKTTTTTTDLAKSTGTWFGEQNAYKVLTFNPSSAPATKVTPFNFKGTERATGKTFIGDNDVSNASVGYGIMIPGAVIDYTVTDPIADGRGDIMHDVAEVRAGNTIPPALKVWGTEVAGTSVQKGRLVIPKATGLTPKLTFTPETVTTGSWFHNGTVHSSKVGSTDVIIPERLDSKAETWTATDLDYSYDVKVDYSNKAELSARNVILKESEAKNVTKADVEDFTEVNGRPFLSSNIDAVLDAIKAPLADDQYSRVTEVTYNAGTAVFNPANTITEKVNVVVVKDNAVVSADRHGSIYAEEATFKLMDRPATKEALEEHNTKVWAVRSDGTTTRNVNSNPADYFATLSSYTDADVPKTLDVEYQYNYDSEDASKIVKIPTKIHVMPNESDLVVKFIDEAGNSFVDENGDPIGPIPFKQTIGSTIDLTKEASVQAALAKIKAQRYILEKAPDNESAVPFVNGGSEAVYEFKGTLSILSAPSSIDFRVQTENLKENNRVTDPDIIGDSLVVFDNRTPLQSWTLTVTLTTPMNNGGEVLKNALRYKQGKTEKVLSVGVAEEILVNTHTNSGEYNVTEKEWEAKKDGFIFDIPPGSINKLGKYSGDLLFTVANTK